MTLYLHIETAQEKIDKIYTEFLQWEKTLEKMNNEINKIPEECERKINEIIHNI